MGMDDNGTPWRTLHQYWLDRHIGDKPPGREAIDPPIEIPRLAKKLMLIEVCPDGLRYRVIGSSIASYMQVDLTGQLVAETGWTSEDIRGAWRNLLQAVADSGKPQLVITKFASASKSYNHCLVLPLIGDTGKTRHLLIGVFYGGYIEAGAKIAGLATVEVSPSGDLPSHGV
jgi:hypothetical protein